MNVTKLSHFYATGEDLLPLLGEIEEEGQLKYVPTGLQQRPDPPVYLSGRELPNPGRAEHESAIACASYLVMSPDEPITIRRVPQRSGGEMYATDQASNQRTIQFMPGGIYSNEILLYGRFGTISDDFQALHLQDRFLSSIRKQFTKIKKFYVGAQAVQLLDRGIRLTISAQSSSEFDLRR